MPSLSEPHAVGIAKQQRRAGVILQGTQVSAERGLRYSEGAGRRRDAARLDDACEHAEQLEIVERRHIPAAACRNGPSASNGTARIRIPPSPVIRRITFIYR